MQRSPASPYAGGDKRATVLWSLELKRLSCTNFKGWAGLWWIHYRKPNGLPAVAAWCQWRRLTSMTSLPTSHRFCSSPTRSIFGRLHPVIGDILHQIRALMDRFFLVAFSTSTTYFLFFYLYVQHNHVASPRWGDISRFSLILEYGSLLVCRPWTFIRCLMHSFPDSGSTCCMFQPRHWNFYLHRAGFAHH